jgi:hypothetical protein
MLAVFFSGAVAVADEPATISPFGPVKHEREDAIPGYLEMSDGTVFPGNIYMTRDKRLKLAQENDRQREIPLRMVTQIECKVMKEWIEREWKFKELANDEKMYTGKSYPARVYQHTLTLKDGRTLTGELAEIFYVQPLADASNGPLGDTSRADPRRFMVNKRNKGENGKDLKSLKYVKVIKLGKEAYEEGLAKASGKKVSSTTSKKTAAKKVSGKGLEPDEEEPEKPAPKKRKGLEPDE